MNPDLESLVQQLIRERDEARARAEVSRHRLVALQSATLALAASRSAPAAIEVVLTLGLESTGADAGAVALVEEGDGVLRAMGEIGRVRGLLPAEVPLDDSTPLGRVLTSGRPLLAPTADAIPAWVRSGAWSEGAAPAALAVLPLSSGRVSVGVLALCFAEPQPFDEPQRIGLDALAKVAGAALLRIRLLQDEEQARTEIARSAERNAFLAEATALVSAPLDEATVLDRLARLCVPRLGDWCTISRPQGDRLHRVLVHHHDPAMAELARSLQQAPLLIHGDTPVSRTFRTGVPQLMPDLAGAMAADPRFDRGQLEVFRRLGAATGITVPIGPASRPVGVLAFAVGPGRTLTEDDVTLAVEIALRAGIAVTHAESFARERDAAALLQQAILPPALPVVPGVELAAAYRPADVVRSIGGDWYDAFLLDDGRIALAVGDVAGHGLAAAATMGQLRHALRAYLFEGHPPGEALKLLNLMLTDDPVPRYATAVAAVLDPGDGQVVVASAGHLPPLLVGGADEPHPIDGPRGPLLGVLPAAHFPEIGVRLHRDDVIALFTDGLVERRRRSVDDSVADLVRTVAAFPPHATDLQDWCDTLIRDQGRGRDHDDDSCLLVLRAGDRFTPRPPPAHDQAAAGSGAGSDGSLLALDLEPGPGVARQVRHWLASVLPDHPALPDLQLCVTEAVTNVVVHARTPFTVSVHDVERGVRIEVRDGSPVLPQVQPKLVSAPRGRGLQLLEALSSRWGTDVVPDGKVVWFEFPR